MTATKRSSRVSCLDNVGGLLRELPSLPSWQAILLGWAAPIPVLVKVDELPEEHRPHSADPDFWDVWTLKKPRPIDWAGLAADWANVVDEAESDAPPDNDNLNTPTPATSPRTERAASTKTVSRS